MSFDLTQKIKVVNPTSNIDELYGPYTSVANALSGVPVVLRQLGRTVGIIEGGVIQEYWFKNGITDSDLILKSTEEVDTFHSVVLRNNITSEKGIYLSTSRYTGNAPLGSITNIYVMSIVPSVTPTGTSNRAVLSGFPNLTTGSWNFAAGSTSSITTGTGNTTVGSGGAKLTTGKSNTIIGYNGNALTSGSQHRNTLIGHSAGSYIDNGTDNIMIGYRNGQGVVNGVRNIFIGNGAGQNNKSGSTDVSNKLAIHSDAFTTHPTNMFDSATLGSQHDYKRSLISGDFEERWVNINGYFSITPARMPNATAAETKKVVWNPTTGVFAVKDDTSGGTTVEANKQRFTGDTISAKTLSHTPMTNSVSVILNGLELDEQGGDYTVSGTTVTLVDEPLTTDVIVIKYLY